MNKRVCFFCVGTGGHVLPVRNLIKELKELGTNNEVIFVICDNRGRQYLDNLDVSIHTPKIFASKKGVSGYIFNIFTISRSIKEVTKILKKPIWWSIIYFIIPIGHIIVAIQIAKLFEKKILFIVGLILLP